MNMEKSVDVRGYQQDLINRVMSCNTDDLIVLPTGGGKTIIISELCRLLPGRIQIVAHRKEIIKQIENALPNTGRVVVGSIDTLIRRNVQPADVLIIDEGHHAISSNKWGTIRKRLSGARLIGTTATPERNDGNGLDLYHRMVEGPTVSELMAAGYLLRPVIYAPANDLNRLVMPSNQNQIGEWVRASKITGDVVEAYLKFAPCALGMTFAADVEHGREISSRFNSVGIPAELVTAKTINRGDILERFKRRELLQLVNVDIYGEGTDVPDLEVVSLARPTRSLAVHRQQTGRVLRPGGRTCIIIDHVGNTIEHGPPDMPVVWSLLGRTTTKRSVSPYKACNQCTAVYERMQANCPYCGYSDLVTCGSGINSVLGDLVEFTPDQQRKLLAEVRRVNNPGYFSHLSGPAKWSAEKKHNHRLQALKVLDCGIKRWLSSFDDSLSSQRFFYLQFGIDTLTARTLSAKKALELARKIAEYDEIRKVFN